MKEVIIRYKDSRTLDVLKSLAKYFDFSIAEKKEESANGKKKVSFTVLAVAPLDAQNYKFNRDEANER